MKRSVQFLDGRSDIKPIFRRRLRGRIVIISSTRSSTPHWDKRVLFWQSTVWHRQKYFILPQWGWLDAPRIFVGSAHLAETSTETLKTLASTASSSDVKCLLIHQILLQRSPRNIIIESVKQGILDALITLLVAQLVVRRKLSRHETKFKTSWKD